MIATRPRVVLIVEDSEDCAVGLEIALEGMAGIEVRKAANVTAALRWLENDAGRVAAVITDFRLPEMSGLDLVKRIRADARFARTPVLMISGDSDPRIPQRALDAGADAFFAKPYSPLAVLRTLKEFLV